jgi:hypothetical protein
MAAELLGCTIRGLPANPSAAIGAAPGARLCCWRMKALNRATGIVQRW